MGGFWYETVFLAEAKSDGAATAVMWISGIVVTAVAVYMLGLALLIVVRPALVERFLRSFAGSMRAHLVEQAARLIAGFSFVYFAPLTAYSEYFRVFGWLLIVTTLGLLLVPWRWHRSFAEWVVPVAIRYLRFFALGALGMGALILYVIADVVLPL